MLIASLKNMWVLLLSATMTLKNTSVFDKPCIDLPLLICFPTLFFISHFSPSHHKVIQACTLSVTGHVLKLETAHVGQEMSAPRLLARLFRKT